MAGALFQISERSIFPALSGVVATLICWHCPIHLVSIIHYCQDPLIISHNRMLHLLHGGSLQRVQTICDPSLGWRILFLVHHQIMLDFWTEPSETTPSKSGRKITLSHHIHQTKTKSKICENLCQYNLNLNPWLIERHRRLKFVACNFPLWNSVFIFSYLETRVTVLDQANNPINDNKRCDNDWDDHRCNELNDLKRRRSAQFCFSHWI